MLYPLLLVNFISAELFCNKSASFEACINKFLLNFWPWSCVSTFDKRCFFPPKYCFSTRYDSCGFITPPHPHDNLALHLSSLSFDCIHFCLNSLKIFKVVLRAINVVGNETATKVLTFIPSVTTRPSK